MSGWVKSAAKNVQDAEILSLAGDHLPLVTIEHQIRIGYGPHFAKVKALLEAIDHERFCAVCEQDGCDRCDCCTTDADIRAVKEEMGL